MMCKPIGLVLLAICICLAVAGACAAPPAAASVDLHLVVPAPYLVISADERGAGDLLLLTALAAFFGADVHVVVPLYPAWSVRDIVLILAIHHDSHRDIGHIIGLRRRHGRGWGEIAHQLGVHPGAFNKQHVWAKKQDRSVGEEMLVRAIAGHWGLPPADVRAMRARSYPAREIALAANVATRSGKPLGDVLNARASKRSWANVAAGFGASPSQLDKPGKAKGRFGSPAAKVRSNPGKGAGQAAQPGSSPGKSETSGKAATKPDKPGHGAGKGKGPK